MQVVLKKRVPKLGNEYDVINVTTGYARNFLFPQKLAVPASKDELKLAENMKSKMVAKVEELMANAKEIAEKLKGTVLTFKEKAKEDKLYGSIKEKDIMDELAKLKKVEIKKEMVVIDEQIKTLGEHKVKLQLTEDTSVDIKIVVEAE